MSLRNKILLLIVLNILVLGSLTAAAVFPFIGNLYTLSASFAGAFFGVTIILFVLILGYFQSSNFIYNRKKTEDLINDLKKFRLAIENVSDHIVITDKEGTILYMNPSAEKITGFSAKESLGKKAGSKDLWGGIMTKGCYTDLWNKIKIKKKTYKGNLTNKRKNGEQYEAEIQVSPILNDTGEVVFFVGVERDVTKYREIDRAKSEFVSIASHQLRTPLTAIKWHVEMLLAGDAGPINKDQEELVAEIFRSNEGMIELVNALLNVSRVDMGTFAIDPVNMDVTELTDSVISELAPAIKRKKVSLQKKYSPKVPLLRADPVLLRMVIQNLISNAVQYSKENGKVSVKINLRKKDVLFSVIDNGYGITMKQQDKIFGKLFRADNAIAHDTEGSGLGLYVSKAIVEQAGGKIWFKSTEGKGTAFYFTILLKGMQKKKGSKVLTLSKK